MYLKEILEGLIRVEGWNDQFRQPNPNGRYPICKPIVGGNVCQRCGWPTNIPSLADDRPPCPAVPPENRWGEDWNPSGAFEEKRMNLKETEDCCAVWPDFFPAWKWFGFEHNQDFLAMPYRHLDGQNWRVNYCPACGAEVRNCIVRRERIEQTIMRSRT